MIAPLDVPRVILSQRVHDLMGTRSSVVDIAQDMQLVDGQALDNVADGDDEVIGATCGDDGINDDIDVSSLGSDFETLDLMFHTWKADCPEKEDKKKKDSQQQQAQALGRSGLFSIVSQIISYPAEATTPIQDKEFISRMKAQAASLL